jgi:hypothetical protein
VEISPEYEDENLSEKFSAEMELRKIGPCARQGFRWWTKTGSLGDGLDRDPGSIGSSADRNGLVRRPLEKMEGGSNVDLFRRVIKVRHRGHLGRQVLNNGLQ